MKERSRQPFAVLAPLLVISPLFPPMSGGLPDHTDRLAHALSGCRSVTVLTSTGGDEARSFRVRAVVRRWSDPAAVVQAVEAAAPTGPLLWQYVPHMYGRGGVNLRLPSVAAALRARGRRQLVLVHEMAAPYSWWPHRSFYAWAHRRMWRGWLRHADALGISTGGWLENLQRRNPGDARFFLAPSPSNLPVVTVGGGHREQWRKELGLDEAGPVLGFFGTLGAGKQFEWVLSAWREVRLRQARTALVVIGGQPAADLSLEERGWIRGMGYVEPMEASRALQALDLLLLPFVDGVSERRSTFMAGLAHGVPVLTTLGPATGGLLRRGGYYRATPLSQGEFAAAAASLAGDAVAPGELGRAGRVHYEAHFDWPVLARGLLARLESLGT